MHRFERIDALAHGFGLAVLVACSVPACDGCGKEQPYTPFGVATAQPEGGAPVARASTTENDASTPKPGFSPRAATAATAGATRWTLEGRTLDAPAGRAFERGLGADFDGDGKTEIVAWTVAAGSATAGPGELWLYPSLGPAKKLAELPGFVPTGPACSHTTALAQSGPHSVTLDIGAKCQTALLSRAPTRALLVVSPLATRAEVLALRLADPAPGETLGVAVDSSDRDGDGRGDVRLTVTVGREGERPASLDFVWLDRAAGTSRDATEPRASLERLAAGELWRSKTKKLAPSVRSGVESARRLMAAACSEGGAPRVHEGDGAALSCGPLGTVVDRLLEAETRAALAGDDVLAAFASFDRDGWYFAKAGDKTKKDVEKRLLDTVKLVESPKTVSVSTELAAVPSAPHFGRLAFDSDAALIIQGRAGATRVGRTGQPEPVADGGVAWPLEIARGDGAKLTHVIAACDENVISFAFAGASSQKTTLLSPRPGACAGGHAPKMAFVPLSIKGDAVEGLVNGEPVGPKTSRAEAAMRPQVLGAPRSPDGKLLVAPTSLGLLVVGGDKPELWRAGAQQASECAVANGAERVACVDQGAVKMWVRP